MAKQTKETYWEQGKADHAAVKLGNHYALARQAWADGSQSWQANAYRAGMQEAQDIESGYYDPERVWMRTANAERLALLHVAKLGAHLAGKSYSSMSAYAQARIARAINGEPQIEETPEASKAAAKLTYARLIMRSRERAIKLRRKHGPLDKLASGTRLQGPRHAPGTHWPSGDVVANSYFVKTDRVTNGNETIWQWAALDASGKLLHIVEYSDLWTLREIAAYNIADGYRFVRSHKGH